MKKYAVATERWDVAYKKQVHEWLKKYYGPEEIRWGQEFDYGFEDLWMYEDVYTMFVLKWG